MFNTKLIQELELYIFEHKNDTRVSNKTIFQTEDKLAESTPSYLKKSRKLSPKASKEIELFSSMDLMESMQAPPDIKNYIDANRSPKFDQVLFNFIDDKQLDDSEVYKKANIDRRLFSKIRTVKNYKPKKTTALALGLALELDNKDMETLLTSAGYALGKSDTLDLVIHFCLEKKIYNIIEVNNLLDYFSASLL